MPDAVQQIISRAKRYSRRGFLKRYAGYECLKSELQCLDIDDTEYQQAVKQLSAALKL